MLQRYPYLVLVLLCLVLFLPGITNFPLVDRDSAHFAQATRQMVEADQYLSINFQNEPRHLKPPGIYWLQAISVKLFANQLTTLWPYRLPSVLAAIFTVLITFYFTSRFYDWPIALLAAALLAMSFFLALETRLIVTDIAQLASITCMQGALWRVYVLWHRQENVGFCLPLVFWTAMAIGIVFKGIAPLIAILTVLGLIIVDKRSRWLLALQPLLGITWLCLLTLLWLVPLSRASHSDFLWDMISQDLLPKIIHGQQSHGMPPGYYALTLPMTLWPISCLFWWGAYFVIKHRSQADIKFLLLWIVSNWLVFECIHTKLPEYLLPIYPAITIAIALGIHKMNWSDLSNNWQRWFKIYYILWSFYSFGLAIFIALLPKLLNGGFALLAILISCLLIVLTSLILYYLYQQRFRAVILTCFCMAVIFYSYVFAWLLPNQPKLWLSEQVAEALPVNAISNTNPLLAIAYQEPSLVFLLGTHKVQFSTLADATDGPVGRWLLISPTEERGLISVLATKGLTIHTAASLYGYNYSNGKWLNLKLDKVIADES